MTAKELQQLILQGESETLEFKKSSSLLREGIETLCAFANKRGGQLIFGIKDNGIISGQHVTDDTLKNIANSVKLNTDPKLYPSIEKIYVEGGACVLVTIEESPLKPHLAYGRPYLRLGPSNQRLDRDRYEYLLQQRMNGYGFDYTVNSGAGLEDIDTDILYEFLETANSIRDMNENVLLPPELILQKMDLVEINGSRIGVKNAAIMLFGKSPQKFFESYYEVKCGKFPDNTNYEEILNEQEFKGNLIRNFHSALNFLLESIEKNSRKDGVLRKERYEFPVSVLREALVNMLVHRDYRQGIKSTIEIRPSHILFYNPAQLFGPTITIERLKTLHPSRPGNKLIAKVFYMMGLFENWGGGTLNIVRDTCRCGKPEPEFAFEGGMFSLTLPR